MATETDMIEVQFRAVGGAAVATEFDQISVSSKKSEVTVKAFDSTMKAANDTTRQFSDQTTHMASQTSRAFGVTTLALQTMGEGFGAVGRSAMQVASNVTIFASLVGGPLGIAMGLGVAALGLFMSEMDNTAEHAKNLDDALKRLKARTSQIKDVDSSAVFFEADKLLRPGDAGFEDALKGHEGAGGSKSRGGRLVSPNGKSGAAQPRPAQPRPDPEFDAMQRRDDNERRIAALDAKESQARQRQIESDMAREQTASQARIDQQKSELETRLDQENAAREESLAADEAMYEQRSEAAKANADNLRSVGVGVYSAVGNAGLDAFRKLGQGQKMSTKEVLASIGDQIAATGQGHMLQAGAMFFVPGMQANAGGLLAAGALELAFGVGLGAAMHRGGGGDRSTRGKAGVDYAAHRESGAPRESGGDYLDRTRASSPSSRSGGGGGGGGTTVVNVTMPTVISPTADDAVRIKQALREGERAGV